MKTAEDVIMQWFDTHKGQYTDYFRISQGIAQALRDAGLLDESESEPESEPEPTRDNKRCAVCGWLLVESWEDGCVRGNCSLRPGPNRLYDPERAKKEQEEASR